jgi:hypothetical protein
VTGPRACSASAHSIPASHTTGRESTTDDGCGESLLREGAVQQNTDAALGAP